MKKVLRVILKTLLIIVVVLVALSAGFLIYSSLTDYQPQAVEELSNERGVQKNPVFTTDFSFLSWNIGYCGLGREMDFFYDGGSHSKPGEDFYQEYLNGIYNRLADYDSIDFFLLQEVDSDASRSYHTDQTALIRESLEGHTAVFAQNYKVGFVPLPVTRPMGEVQSGMMSCSRFVPASSQRIASPVNYSWPMKIFMLDRCFVIQRFRLAGSGDLVIINLHNSAYDAAGALRIYELWLLRNFMLAEYESGNFVVAGGDWNQGPPKHDSLRYKKPYVRKPEVPVLENTFFPSGWTLAYDHAVPTNREVSAPYAEGSTLTSTIDFFVCSPNVEVRETRVLDDGFRYSDHQPVYMKIRLKVNPLEYCPDACSHTIQILLDSLIKLNEKMGGKVSGGGSSAKEEPVFDRFLQRK